MRNQYKILAERYEQVLEADQEPVMTVVNNKLGGKKEWRLNGKLHRLDGPAIEHPNGSKEWYQNDKLHRLDGPAFEHPNGTKSWYQNGKLHRLDGPAIEHPNGDKTWWVENKLHRLDGPAIEWSNGHKEWYINGIKYNKKEFQTQANIFKGLEALSRVRSKKPIKENADEQPVMTIDKYGTKEWKLNNVHHRLNGPAVIKRNGTKLWYQNGEIHRLDGPAVISTDGTKFWYQNEELHRLEGPAIEYEDGTKEWYINNKQYSEEEFKIRVNTLKGLEALARIRSKKPIKENTDEQPVMTVDERGIKEWKLNGKRHRLDGPAVEWPGGRYWYQNGELHRLDGPAKEWNSGHKEWYQNDKLHRLDGPAVERAGGSKIWYINNKAYSEKDYPTAVNIYKGLEDLARIRSKQQ